MPAFHAGIPALSVIALLLAITSVGCGPMSNVGQTSCTVGGFSTEQSPSPVGIGKAPNIGLAVAQSFSLTSAATVASVQLKLRTVGTFASNNNSTITVSIRDDSSGTPNNAVAAADAYYVRNIASTAGYVTFTLSTPASLSASTTYWVVALVSYAANTSNYVEWSGNNDPLTGYSGGMTLYKDISSGSWVSSYVGTDQDMVFVLGC